MPEKTDEEIAVQVQHGDVESFGVLIERYEQKILRYARRFFPDNEDVKDFVQEVFIKAYVNIQSFDAARKFSPWIYRIAHNEFINAIKKKSRLAVSLFDLDTLSPHLVAKESADSEAQDKDLKRILEKGFIGLDPKYKEPLILYYFEEMDYREIAEILHVPVSTVGVRLQRGKVMLKKVLKDFKSYE